MGVSMDTPSLDQECTRSSQFAIGHSKERRSGEHLQGTPEEKVKDGSMEYNCTVQVSKNLFIILGEK